MSPQKTTARKTTAQITTTRKTTAQITTTRKTTAQITTTRKKALVSLSNKTGILDFAKQMSQDFDFISTAGTKQYLEKAGINCTAVSQFTRTEEILDGRVKTLHSKIYAAILSRRSQEDEASVRSLKIEVIDMVVVNFYPFESALKTKKHPIEMLEWIDIGGPTMLRAAAKNYPFVLPICDSADYTKIAQIWQKKKEIPLAERKKLAAKAFELCANLDLLIANYLSKDKKKYIFLTNKKKLRYGENPHQKGWLYSLSSTKKKGLAQLEVLQGKALSYNNYLDIQSAIRVITGFVTQKSAPYLTSIIKHNNPCGLASGKQPQESIQKAWEGDAVSAFGSIIAHNKKVNLDFAKFLVSPEILHYNFSWQVEKYLPQKVKKKFFEILIAPDYEPKALELLKNHSQAILLKYPIIEQLLRQNKKSARSLFSLDGVVLEQEKDNILEKKFICKTKKKFPKSLYPLVHFGIMCCKNSKSNAISLVREYTPSCYQLLGAGFGQPNRIDALVKLAVPKMQENLEREYKNLQTQESYENWYLKQLQGVLLISDAFFPFPDIVEAADYYKISHLVQPAGSRMDSSIVQLCDKKNMAMVETGIRHFLH